MAVPDPTRVSALRWYAAFALIGTALVALSALLFSRDFDPDFLSFLAALIGGWLWGLALGGVILRTGGWGDIALLAVVAVGLVAAMWAVTGPWSDSLRAVPTGVRGIVVALQFAVIPMAGWLAMTALSAVSTKARVPVATRVPPQWRHDGVRSRVRFPAIPMPLRTLVLAIVIIVVVLGVGIAALLALTGDRFLLAGPRFAIIVLGLVAGLPAYLILVAVLRRGQIDVDVLFDDTRLVISGDGRDRVIPFADVAELSWGGGGEYSRLRVVTTAGEKRSYIAGLARVPKGVAASLPPLPRPIRRRLELAGLTPKPGSSRRREQDPQVFVRALRRS